MADSSGHRSGMARNWFATTASIPNGSALSETITHAGRPIVGFIAPEAWTQASITFDVMACPNGTFYPLYGDDNAEVRMSISACRAYASDTKLEKLAPFYAFRIRSGSTVGSRDDQGANRTFSIFLQG